jgi:hypothetical protein
MTTQSVGNCSPGSIRSPRLPSGRRSSPSRHGSPEKLTDAAAREHHNAAFETTKLGTWRIESTRGFVRELNPNPVSGVATAAAVAGAMGKSSIESAAEGSTAATEASTSFAAASTTRRSTIVQSLLPALAAPSIGFPLNGEQNRNGIDRLIADQLNRSVSDSRDGRPQVAPTSREPLSRAPAIAAPITARTVSSSVNPEVLDDAFVDQAFVDTVTVAL